jgi:diguanylate cyclase (GGDEF)-like protein
MARTNYNLAPKTVIPWAANIALGGVVAYFAGKSRQRGRQIQHHEKVEKHLMYQATHDELTGELNRRGMARLLAESKQSPRAMLRVDTTHLKKVNDTLGHRRGDEAIVATVQVLRESLRPDDVIARTGGDEFHVLLDPERRRDHGSSSPDGVLVPVIERVSKRTQRLLGREENFDLGEVGFDVAVGGAVWEPGMTFEDVDSAADAALYEVKEAQHAAYGTSPR